VGAAFKRRPCPRSLETEQSTVVSDRPYPYGIRDDGFRPEIHPLSLASGARKVAISDDPVRGPQRLSVASNSKKVLWVSFGIQTHCRAVSKA